MKDVKTNTFVVVKIFCNDNCYVSLDNTYNWSPSRFSAILSARQCSEANIKVSISLVKKIIADYLDAKALDEYFLLTYRQLPVLYGHLKMFCWRIYIWFHIFDVDLWCMLMNLQIQVTIKPPDLTSNILTKF